MLTQAVSATATGGSLSPALIVFGAGIGLASAQLTNVIMSSTPLQFAGETSAVNTTMRQVGTSVGIAFIGAILAGSLATNIADTIATNTAFPPALKEKIIASVQSDSVERFAVSIPSEAVPNQPVCYMQNEKNTCMSPLTLRDTITVDIKQALVASAKLGLTVAGVLTFIGYALSLFIPNTKYKQGNK
jgi:hypothetical protein